MLKDNDFIHLPELYLTLETLKKHIKQHYNLNITNMANENKHSGYNDEQMAMTQLDIIHRYSVKLDTMITQEAYLEEWVKMKLSRVELMIASVKHALEGVEKFEDGGELARQQLLHISKYSAKLIVMLKEGSVLMSWMESNIAICADYMDGIYHHLDYTMGNRAKQMEYRDGGGVDSIKTINKYINEINDIGSLMYLGDKYPKFTKVIHEKDFGDVSLEITNKKMATSNKEFIKEVSSLAKHYTENAEYDAPHINPSGEKYIDGGGVGMAERGKRIYTDWKGKKSNENWGKYNLYDKYNNILDLCADLVDFLRKTKEQLGEDYYISAKRDLLSALNSESVGYFDNGVLKFNAGGGIGKKEKVYFSTSGVKNEDVKKLNQIVKSYGLNLKPDTGVGNFFIMTDKKTLEKIATDLELETNGISWITQSAIEYKNGGGVGGKVVYFTEEQNDTYGKLISNYMNMGHEELDAEELTLRDMKKMYPRLKGELTGNYKISNKTKEYSTGGGVGDGYGDMNPEQVWNNWSSSQRYHFIYDHMKQSTPRTQEDLSKKAYSFLPANVKQELHEHIHMGKYNAGGGVGKFQVGDDVIFNVDPSGRLSNDIYYGTILEIDGELAKIDHINNNMKNVIRTVNVRNLKKHANGGGVDMA